ncbi:MAG TPA: hypothetical protein VJP87_09005 [Candidatus Acidoferrales bacterium]|nr:hypothetical protein [Candidatus Acidoferrales bacterium]
MTPEPQRGFRLSLPELVTRYLSVAMEFGIPVALSAFALSPEETEQVFTAYDQDYHISRFLRFSNSVGTAFTIDGQPVTHVTIDRDIQSIL